MSATPNKFIMRADDINVVAPGARGRNSVRITSNKAYADSVTVLDLQHMPEGCSTWPAFWSLSQQGPWPEGGEIDIVEGECPTVVCIGYEVVSCLASDSTAT